MRVGGKADFKGVPMGPALPDPILDIPSSFRRGDYSRYLAFLALNQQKEIEVRVTAVEPVEPPPMPVTSIGYAAFPTVETFDAVFATTPVATLNTDDGVATYEYNKRTKLDITFYPYMGKGFFGAVGTAVGTFKHIGAGVTNTAAVEAAVTEWGAAARVVQSLDFGGFTDWFIPSHEELIEIYNALGSLTEMTADVTADRLNVAISSTEDASPNDDTHIRTVNMETGVSTDTVLKYNQTDIQGGASQGATIPARAYNSDALVNVGDAGPAGGVVFYVDAFLQKGFAGSAGTAVGTGDLIGDGETNQTAWEAAVTAVNANCNIVGGLDVNGKNDWFIPAHDELIEIYNNLASFPNIDAAVTAAEIDIVCSSSEADAPDDDTHLKTVEFSTGTNTNTILKRTPADLDNADAQGAVIPARYIDDVDGPFAIGDTGPGGGIVFYDAGSQQSWGQYIEALDGWYRCYETIDAAQGSWYYDRANYLTADINEQFYPTDEFQNPPYLNSGIYETYPAGGVVDFPNIGVTQTLFYVDEAVMALNAETSNGSLVGADRVVVISILAAP